MPDLNGTIMVVRDLMLDVYINGDATRLSPEAPVPVVNVTNRSQTLGGAGNVALNLVGLGCGVCIYGMRGDDVAGEAMVDILHSKNILSTLYVDPVLPTATKTRVMANHQQLVRFDDERLNGNHSCFSFFRKAISEMLGAVNAIILSDYGKGVLSYDILRYIIEAANFANIPVLVDPKQTDWSCYRGASVITPNTSELEKVVKVRCDDDMTALIYGQSLKTIYEFGAMVVTRGAKGMLVIEGESYEYIPTVAKSVFDVSGAGDTVIATMAACMASGYSVCEAAKVANVAAGIVVGKLGTAPIELKELVEAL